MVNTGPPLNWEEMRTKLKVSDGELRNQNKVETVSCTIPRIDDDINDGVSTGAFDTYVAYSGQTEATRVEFRSRNQRHLICRNKNRMRNGTEHAKNRG